MTAGCHLHYLVPCNSCRLQAHERRFWKLIRRYYYYYFRMLAQSYTTNLYTPPLYRNFFIILSPLFFATVSIPIRFEPRIHPPVEWEHRETKTRGALMAACSWSPCTCPGTHLPGKTKCHLQSYALLGTKWLETNEVSIPVCFGRDKHAPALW